MGKARLVCPECRAELDELRESGRTMDTGYGVNEEGKMDDPNGNPDNPNKHSYCCPICGYAALHVDAFLALS